MKTSTVVIIIFGLLLLGLTLEQASAWRVRDSLFPVIVGVPSVCLAIVQIWLDTRQSRAPSSTSVKEDGTKFSTWGCDLKGKNLCYLWAFAWTGGIVLMIYLLGFYVAIPLFLLLYFKFHGNGWRYSIGLTAVISSVLFLAFVVGFKFYFYQGLLFEKLGIYFF